MFRVSDFGFRGLSVEGLGLAQTLHSCMQPCTLGLLGGSWVLISGVISPLIWNISIVTLLIAVPITTHGPPSGVPALK